ncbi:hypothetical protein [Halobacillus litoralis]|uniref:Uncharacterized protein n=1 Tax=Halobacillus litoralis TaxID=45668 RepID=A0A410MDH2_9BACI|nr:hypothetical protein [Halobacillus litoralis]QAS52782.1 hypothetical protein HLI_11540 [Halobacillus litoralis]
MVKYKLLHYLSLSGMFMTIYGVLYFVQNYSIGLLPIFDQVLFGVFPLNFIVFSVTSLLIINKFVVISSPYEEEFSS